MAEKSIQFDGEKVHYRVEGSGNPVVLVHGFGEDGTIWDKLIPGLAKTNLCIIPDLPGSGKSTLSKACSMESLARSIEAIASEEKIGKAIYIGHSMGGYITLALAELVPGKIKSFGLFHSTAFPDSEEKIKTRQKGIQFIEQHGSAKFLEQAIPNLFSEETKQKNPELVKQIIARYANLEPKALVHYYHAMIERPDRTHILKSFPGPILFIMGEHDTAVPLKDGLQQCHMPQLAYIHLLKHSGHLGMLEETDKCQEILQKFLEEG